MNTRQKTREAGPMGGIIYYATTLCCLLAPIAELHAGGTSENARDRAIRELTELDLGFDPTEADPSLLAGVSFGAFQDSKGAQDPGKPTGDTTSDPAKTDGMTSGADAGTNEGFGDIWTRKQLLGDWWGLRSDQSKHGIDIDLRLSQYYQGVVSGGVNTNGEYGGTMDYRLNVDWGKLAGLEGLSVNLHARTRWGQDVSADAGALVLENAGLLMPAPGDYHGTNVTGLTVSQYFPFFFDRIGNVTVGKLDVIDLVTEFFPAVGYGQEGFSNVNGMVTALPWFGAIQGLSLYGGWLVTVNKEYQTIESGFVFAGTQNESTSWGSISDAFDEGVWLAGFHRFLWKLDDKPGYFMIFAGGSTRAQASNEPLDFIVVPGQGIESTESKKPWDIAFYLNQVLWQAEGDPTRKVQLMAGGTIGPDNPQFAQWHIFANVEAFGPMASRPHDRMGVSGWYAGLSGDYKDLVSPVEDLGDLWGVELYYNVEITPWFHLTPDLQIVQNERQADDIAVILGLRGVVDF